MPSLLVAHHRPGFYFRVIEEGDVGAGDGIERLSVGPEQVTIADIDALLYLPHKSTQMLERALRIPALSDGWRESFQSMRDRGTEPSPPPAAWSGFVPLKVSAVHRESGAIVSLILRPAEGKALVTSSRPGQYLTVRVHPNGADQPAVIRSTPWERMQRA